MGMQRIAAAAGVALVGLTGAYALTIPRQTVEYTVTSVPTPVPSSVQIQAPQEVSVLFAGDMMFDRSVRQYAEKYGGDYLFDCIQPTLDQADVVVANLEGPITNKTSMSVGSIPGGENNFTFTFPISTASLLKAHNIDVVNLGNNHITNFGISGVRSTIATLEAAGVGHFGDPLTNAVFQQDINGVQLSFINYNEFEPPGVGTASTTLAQIAQERALGRLPIVYTHWGVEYATTSPAYITRLAHKFVDAGAAAVIGSHPHVVEQSEKYRGVPIYYSLGNFIFDQYFSYDVSHGLLLVLTISNTGVVGAKEIKTVLTNDRKVCLDTKA